MKITVTGKLVEDLFGIPFLKKTISVNQELTVGSVVSGSPITLKNGEITLGIIPTTEADGTEQVEFKLAVFSLVVFDKKQVVANFIGSHLLKAGGGQLTFTGTLDVEN